MAHKKILKQLAQYVKHILTKKSSDMHRTSPAKNLHSEKRYYEKPQTLYYSSIIKKQITNFFI